MTTRKSENTSADDLIPKQLTLPSLKAAAAECKACDLWKKERKLLLGERPASSKSSLRRRTTRQRRRPNLANHSLVQQGDYSMKPWQKPVSIENRLTLRMLSNTSNGSHVVKRRICTKAKCSRDQGSSAMARGGDRFSETLKRSLPWVQPQHRLFSVQSFCVTKQRGKFLESILAPYIMATVHPSSILRAPDDETRHLEYRHFVDDLKN